LQRPADHVPVESHMVVVAMQDEQGAPRRGGSPDLQSDIEPVHPDASQMLLYLVTEVDSVIGRVLPGLGIDAPSWAQFRYLRDQYLETRLIHPMGLVTVFFRIGSELPCQTGKSLLNCIVCRTIHCSEHALQ